MMGTHDTLVICEFQTWVGSCHQHLYGNLKARERERVHAVNPLFFHELFSNVLGGGGHTPTTGLLAVALALRACTTVDVYGYGNGASNTSSCWYYYRCIFRAPGRYVV